VADGRLVLTLHFPEPPPNDSEMTIVIEVAWPGMCAPLMRVRTPDDFTLKFVTPVARARYKIVLPPGYDAYLEPIGFEAGHSGFALGSLTDDNGQATFVFEGTDLPMRRGVGMRLELKGRGAMS
jgi:hypothetical protein